MNTENDISFAVRRFVRQSQNVLSQPKDEAELTATLKCLLCLTSTKCSVEYSLELKQFDICEADFQVAKEEFQRNHYVNVLEYLVDNFTVEWISSFSKKENVTELLKKLFIEGSPHLAFMVLGEAVSSSGVNYRLNKCTDLLEELLLKRTEDLFWNQCQLLSGNPLRQLWPNIITLLATIPDRVTAKQGSQASAFFYPAQFVPHLCQAVYKCLHKVHESIQHEKSCSVEFVAQLLGKLAITGYKEIIWENLLPPIERNLYNDAIWCRLCEHLISDVPERCLESLIVPLIEQAYWYGTVVKFLGDSVLSNRKLKFLLTNKLLLVRYYGQDKIPQNIVGYLSYSPRTKHLLIEILHSLVDVWGDASALKHTSYERHLYLSKTIIVCLAFIEDSDKSKLKQELMPKLMTALHCHLESALPKVRHLGMAVAECLTSTLDPKGEQLKFNYEADEEIRQLKDLLVKPSAPSVCSKERISSVEVKYSMEETTPADVTDIDTEKESEELDSDDDLEPYDMPEDVKVTKFKTPLYLRDCMEGLISSDEPERLGVCIMAAESLVYKHSTSASELAAEFTKVLLHLQDNYAIPGFLVARHKAMVALTCVAPLKVAEHLSTEFYARNYSVRQRLDILEVLSAAAQKLSNPSESITGEMSKHNMTLIQEINPEKSEPQSWRQIVDKRIESKTRRFSKGRQGAAPVEAANKFAPVAGYFFFPLLEVFERRDDVFDILGDDHLLLTRLCYTLGIIMYAALNAPLVRQMGKSLVEFIWTLRYHPQPAVRQSLLFATSMMLLAVPSHILFTDLQSEMVDMKNWIEDVINGDDDNDCRQLAVQAMVLLTKALKQEFGSCEENR